MDSLTDNRYTGLLTQFVRVPLRPHDPRVCIAAGEMPSWFDGEPELGCSGAGWTQAEADAACLGEGIERLLARALPTDTSLRCAYSDWPLEESAIPPDQWGLFHSDQYGSQGFPFRPLTSETECRWTCCRNASTGRPVWVPEELVYLLPRPGEHQRHTFGFSTGLSCGKSADLALLRGTQEVIERDALLGGWWGRYRVDEYRREHVMDLIGSDLWRVLERPNLTYRFYLLNSPFSQHVTMVSLAGIDEEGWVFSVGSACRENRRASWQKSLLEAVQGRHCVRRLLDAWKGDASPSLEIPSTFFEHALYYSIHPDRLAKTVLASARPTSDFDVDGNTETLRDLQAALGANRPILFRNLTPPGIAEHYPGWVVLRVLIPQLQALHGDHRLPFLGGPLWQRSLKDWATVPPHPFA